MRVRALVVLLAINASGFIMAGCAGNASPSPPASAPKIVAPPTSQTVTAGQSATFAVNATGAAPLSYQWSKNGTALNGATSSSYVTPPVTSADNGTQFSVVVSNVLGNVASSAAILTVTGGQAAPQIIAQPVNQTVLAGQSTTFSVTATGTTPLTYQWSKNGTLVSSSASAAYTTPPTTSADNGAQFSVVVSNAMGSVPSAPATLTVDQASAITSGNAATFLVGSTGSFTVTTSGFPPASLAESGTLPSGVIFTNNGDGTAALGGIPASGTAGKYLLTFTASNGLGTPATQAFTLTVNNNPPVFTSASSATFTTGAVGTFSVTTTGTSTPTLTETGALPRGVTFMDNQNGTATLSGNPAAGTGGTYPITINAASSTGGSSQSFTLTVDQAPTFTSANSATLTVGTSALFAVLTSAFPAPSLTETGALPAGVTFVDNGNGSGKLAGIPVAGTGGTYSITFTASNGVGSPAGQSFVLTVDQGPVITSAGSTTFSVGTASTFSVTTTGTPTASLAETGTLPSGITFVDNHNGTATLSGAPAAGTGGTYPLTFTASNGVGTPATQAFALTVAAPPVITSAGSATFGVGTLGTFSVTAAGTPTPVLTETGTLPGGVTFVDNHNGTATLSGTPAAGTGGTYPITIQAASSAGSASQNLTLTVNQSPAITSAASTTLTVGAAGTFTVTATGTPTPALTETGALPSGVSFTSNANGTATLSGTPAAGTGKSYSLTFTATNGVGSPISQTFTLTVNQAPSITSPSSAAFTVGSSASFTLSSTGFPTATLTETGTLPGGVTFLDNHNGSGTLSGTPASGTAGTYSITFTASNGVGTSATQAFVLTVNNPSTGPAITSASSTTFTVGTAGAFAITTTGTPTPTLTETGALPSGVTFKDNGNGTGTLAGTPASGTGKTYSITFTAGNGVGSPASQSFTLIVNEAPAIISPSSTTFSVGASASFTVLTTGFPTPSLTETGALPGGVNFRDNGNGTATLSGTPASGSGGTYAISFNATNGVGTGAAQSFTLTVDAALQFTSASSTTFTVASASTFSVTATGTPTPSLTETGALPSGVTFKDNGNGSATLSGTPVAGTGGNYAITINATNGSGSASQSFTLTVGQAPAVTSVTSTTFVVSTAGTFTVTATGFPAPSLAETGALPSGLAFKDNGNGTATLSGTPAAGTAGVYSLTLTASNGVGTAATQSFTLTVSPGMTCGSGHESILSGQYAFYFQGFDAKGPVAIAGTFSADGTGKVALLAGVEDINTSTGVLTNVPINSAGSSYSVGSDNRGCLTIATASGTSKYAISLGSLGTTSVATRGRLIEVDSTGTLGSGVLHSQDPATFAAAISGNFVFDVSSTLSLSTTTPNRFAMAGSLSASGGVITSGEADFNLVGSVNGGAAGPLAITGGSCSVSSNGRGTLSFDVSGLGTFNASIYVVSATEFYLMNIDAQSSTIPDFAGDAQGQTGPFTTSSMAKNTVFYSIGLCATCGPSSTVAPDLSIGVMSVTTAGSFTLTGDQNQAGTLTPLSLSGTYTVDSRGRVALLSGGSVAYILYLQTTDRGFLLSTGSDVGEGATDGQSTGPFTNAAITGAYVFGSTDPPEQNVSDTSGVANFDGIGAVSGTTDSVAPGSAPSSNAFSQTYSITNGTSGRGTITQNGVTRSIFYIISKSRIVQVDVMNNNGAPNQHPAITGGRI